MCMFVCDVCKCVCKGKHMWRTEEATGCPVVSLSDYSIEAWKPASLGGPPVSTSMVLVLQTHVWPCQDFYTGSDDDSNPDP